MDGPYAHWTYWLLILSKLCFQRVALSGNYEIVAISTDKNTFFNDLDYKADQAAPLSQNNQNKP